MKRKTDKMPVGPAKSPAGGRGAITKRLDRIIELLEGGAARPVVVPLQPSSIPPAELRWTQTPAEAPRCLDWPRDAWGNPVPYAMAVEATSCRRI